MESKAFAEPLTLKAVEGDDTGIVVARISTLGVVDHDGDVVAPGAFGRQVVRIQPYGHNRNAPSIGKGILTEDGNEAILEGRLNLAMAAGREMYESLKFDAADGAPLTEWSYIFDVEDAGAGVVDGMSVRVLKRLRVHSVDPVFLGAGIGTGTLAVKGLDAKAAISSHSTATSDESWDGPANERRLRNDGGAAYLRRAYAWQDPDGDPERKATYRFIHHEVSGDGAVGAANMRACSTGIAVLNGGRGGTTIPASDRRGVYAHLARHMRDGDRDVPELRSSAAAAARLMAMKAGAAWADSRLRHLEGVH